MKASQIDETFELASVLLGVLASFTLQVRARENRLIHFYIIQIHIFSLCFTTFKMFPLIIDK